MDGWLKLDKHMHGSKGAWMGGFRVGGDIENDGMN